MGEGLKEYGKHLLNLALAIAIYLLIQPFEKGHNSLKLYLLGFFAYLLLAVLGVVLIILGNKLENK
jgi:hypothetical protein